LVNNKFRFNSVYNLSKLLVNILSPLISSEFCVKNSPELVQKICNLELDSDECMVSFDIVSLFTSVPICATKSIIFDLLSDDCDLVEALN